jgi:hypothetical protein
MEKQKDKGIMESKIMKKWKRENIEGKKSV